MYYYHLPKVYSVALARKTNLMSVAKINDKSYKNYKIRNAWWHMKPFVLSIMGVLVLLWSQRNIFKFTIF